MATRRKEPPEAALVKAVIDTLGVGGCLAWRQNNLPGFTVVGREKKGTALVRFHAERTRRGIADVGGVTPTGRIIQVECKRRGEKPRPEQVDWLSAIEAKGGIAMVCHDIGEVIMLVNSARLYGWDRVSSPWGRELARIREEAVR